MQLAIKRILRNLPIICDWRMFRVLYTQSELSQLESKRKALQAEYDRLNAEGPDVLEETRQQHPRVSSELHIRELIKYKTRRIKSDLSYQKMVVEEARKYVE